MDKNLIKIHSLSDITISSLVLLAGLVCVLMPSSEMLNILGVATIVVAIFMFLFYKSNYRNTQTGEVLRRKITYYRAEDKESMLKMLANPKTFKNNLVETGQSLMLVTYYSAENVYLQLYQYVPHSYVPCSENYHYKRENVNREMRALFTA